MRKLEKNRLRASRDFFILSIRYFHGNSCHYLLDWSFDDDRCRIRKGYGPENITRLRRFAISIIKLKGVHCVTEKMRELNRNARRVFDYLQMMKNGCLATAA